MYFVTSRQGNNYSVLDTDDLKVDTMSAEELLPILNSGVVVYGVTAFGIENNIPITLILRMYGDDEGDVKDFDGWMLRDYTDEYNTYITQVLDWQKERDALLNQSVRRLLFEALRALNRPSDDFSLLNQSLPVGYNVLSIDGPYATILDLQSNEKYECDFFGCLAIYLDERRSIGNARAVTPDELSTVYGTLTYNTALEAYAESSSLAEHSFDVAASGYQRCTEISVAWSELSEHFGSRAFDILDDLNLPFYDLKKCIRRVPERSQLCPFTVYDLATSFDSGVLKFRSGMVLATPELIAEVYKVTSFVSDGLKAEVGRFLAVFDTKAKVMQRKSTIDSCLAKSREMGITIRSYLFEGFSAGFKASDNVCLMRFPWGRLDITNVFYGETPIANYSYDKFWLVGLTNTGSCWYNFRKCGVEVGTMRASCGGGIISNEEYIALTEAAFMQGISYHSDMIIPLCVSRLIQREDALDLKVVCAIRPDDASTEELAKTGINVVELSLPLLGGKFIEYEDCFAFYALFQTIYIEKSLISHFVGEFEFNDLNDLWTRVGSDKRRGSGTALRKNERALFDWSYKNTRKVLRRVLES